VMWAILALALALVVLGLVVLGYVLTSTGRLTADTGWGRRVRPLGPQVVLIRASRETVFDLASVPYLSANPPRELRERIEVLERGTDMVLAAHRTQAGPFTTVTVETVTFERPQRIGFRLVRGPVPTVTERFVLREADGGTSTELEYDGELGTDGWALGALWGRIVAGYWERTVAHSLGDLKARAEQMSARRAPPERPHGRP
jgi:hypothetical protein